MKTIKESLIKNIKQTDEDVVKSWFENIIRDSNRTVANFDIVLEDGVVVNYSQTTLMMSITEKTFQGWPSGWKVGPGFNLKTIRANNSDIIHESFNGDLEIIFAKDNALDFSKLQLEKSIIKISFGKLTTLNLPKEVKELSISNCEKLKEINGLVRATTFSLNTMPQIKTLKGYCPDKVSMCSIQNCENLQSFEGLPKEIYKFISMNNGQLRKRFAEQHSKITICTVQ